MSEKKIRPTLTEDLVQIDRRIAALLVSRTSLLARAALSRKSKRIGITDPQQEKRLWQVWGDAAKSDNLDAQLLKKIFHLTNNLAYARVERNVSNEKPLCLFPRRQPVNVNLDAPRDQILRSMMFVLGAASSAPLVIAPCQGSNNSLELINALNLCGFNVSSCAGQCVTSPVVAWSMDNKVIYAGQSKFHLYLLLCLALGHVARVKITGATKLKLHDLRLVQDFLPHLGARLTIVEPHSFGVPIRIESSGQVPNEISIPAGLSKKFILALVVAATTFHKDCALCLHESYRNSKLLRKGIDFLQYYIPSIQFDGTQVVIPATPAHLDFSRVDIPLDPLMSLHLLSLPFFTDGTVTLRGKWPGQGSRAQEILDVLFEFGLRIDVGPEQTSAQLVKRPKKATIDLTTCPEYLPLLIAMALGLQAPCTICTDAAHKDVVHAQDLLENIGAQYTFESGLFTILPSVKRTHDMYWQSPGPYWTLAGALISFTYPGLCLGNADNILSAWPWFWRTFMSLPEPQNFIHSFQEDEQADVVSNDKPQRKRIRIITD